MEEKLAFFKENGYYVEHGALSPEEVAGVVAGIESAGGNGASVFHKTTALDLLASPTSTRWPGASSGKALGSPASTTAMQRRLTRHRPQTRMATGPAKTWC